MDLLNETTVKNMCEITSVAEYNSQIEISQNKEKQTVTFMSLQSVWFYVYYFFLSETAFW